VSFISIPKSYEEALMYWNGSWSCMTRWMFSSYVRFRILCLLYLDYL